jgi:allophanate hydrolase subunit 2
VISADLPLLGQITPGDEVAFEAVSMDAAVQALREMEDKVDRFKQSLKERQASL